MSQTRNIFVFFGVLVLLAVGIIFLAAVLERAPQNLAPTDPDQHTAIDIKVTEERENTNLYTVTTRTPSTGAPPIDARIDSFVKEQVDTFKEEAETAGEPPTGLPYALDIDFERVVEAESSLGKSIGILFRVSQDFGGAHGISQLVGKNYLLSTGEEISLTQVLTMADWTLEGVAAETRTHFEETLGENFFEEGTEVTQENFDSFLLADGEVTFYFQPYQVAAYAAGAQEVTLEY